MNTEFLPPPPAALVPATDLERLFSLLAVVKDAKAVQIRLQEIAIANAELSEKLIALQESQRNLDTTQANMKRENDAALDKLLTSGRAQLEKEAARREEQYLQREAAIDARDAQSRSEFDQMAKRVATLREALAN